MAFVNPPKPPPRPDLYGQKCGMYVHQPHFSSKVEVRPEGRILICKGDVQPTPASNVYRTRIEYRMMYRPKVIISPPLVRLDPDKKIPHSFADDRPCLYLNEWNSRMLIGTSIVPWLMLWLSFYESWQFTGIWQGSGHEEEDPVETDTREVDVVKAA